MDINKECNSKVFEQPDVANPVMLYHQNLNFEEAFKFTRLKYKVRRMSWKDKNKHLIISGVSLTIPTAPEGPHTWLLMRFSTKSGAQWGVSNKEIVATDWEAAVGARYKKLSFDKAIEFTKQGYKIWRDAWKPEEKWISDCAEGDCLHVYNEKREDTLFIPSLLDIKARDWNADLLHKREDIYIGRQIIGLTNRRSSNPIE